MLRILFFATYKYIMENFFNEKKWEHDLDHDWREASDKDRKEVKSHQVVFYIVALIIAFLITGYLVQLSWNYVAPQVFGQRPILFAEALVMLILVRLLIGQK